MTRCPHCNHEFHNVMVRQDCPKCGGDLKTKLDQRKPDDGIDVAGFAVGYASGMPISPSHGISGAALLGAALHSSNESHAKPAEHEPPPSGSGGDFGGGGSSSSYDSGSSSSSSSSDSSDSGGGSTSGGE